MTIPNVSGKRPRPTQKAYRSAVATVIRCLKLQHRLTNVDFGDRIGCSDETISNAENERTDLSPVLLLNIEHEFGTGTIDLVLEVAGTHGVPAEVAAGGDVLPALMDVGTGLVKARSPESPGGPGETREELLALEPGLLEVRRGVNRKLAQIRRIREGC